MSLLSPPSPAEREYRETQRDFRRAMRLLRGNPVKRLALRRQAQEEGIDVSSIVRRDDQDQFIRGREARFNLGADEAGRRAEINRNISNEATAPFSSGRRAQIPTDDLRSQRRDEGGVQTTFVESGDPVTVTRSRPASVEIRGPDGSVEKVLEGGNGRTNTVPAGSDTAANAQPTTRLGRFASEALSSIDDLEAEGFDVADDRREFNQGMDRAIRQAKTQEELDELRGIAIKSGIGGDAFDRRTQWWERRR